MRSYDTNDYNEIKQTLSSIMIGNLFWSIDYARILYSKVLTNIRLVIGHSYHKIQKRIYGDAAFDLMSPWKCKIITCIATINQYYVVYMQKQGTVFYEKSTNMQPFFCPPILSAYITNVCGETQQIWQVCSPSYHKVSYDYMRRFQIWIQLQAKFS